MNTKPIVGASATRITRITAVMGPVGSLLVSSDGGETGRHVDIPTHESPVELAEGEALYVFGPELGRKGAVIRLDGFDLKADYL